MFRKILGLTFVATGLGLVGLAAAYERNASVRNVVDNALMRLMNKLDGDK